MRIFLVKQKQKLCDSTTLKDEAIQLHLLSIILIFQRLFIFLIFKSV